MPIKEYDKIKLKDGHLARVVEVLEEGKAYIAEIFKRNGDVGVSVEQVLQTEIASVFEEIEHPIAQVG